LTNIISKKNKDIHKLKKSVEEFKNKEKEFLALIGIKDENIDNLKNQNNEMESELKSKKKKLKKIKSDFENSTLTSPNREIDDKIKNLENALN